MGKTGSQIFKIASALIYEGVNDDKESKAFTIAFLNIHLQECLAAENSIRRSKGEVELTEAPWIESLDTEIDYHDKLTRTALPYACVSHYYAEAMNEERARYFDDKYKDAISLASVAVEEGVNYDDSVSSGTTYITPTSVNSANEAAIRANNAAALAMAAKMAAEEATNDADTAAANANSAYLGVSEAVQSAQEAAQAATQAASEAQRLIEAAQTSADNAESAAQQSAASAQNAAASAQEANENVSEAVSTHNSDANAHAILARKTETMRLLISRTIGAGENVSAITCTQDDAGNALALIDVEMRIRVGANSLANNDTSLIRLRINDVSSDYQSSYSGVSATSLVACLVRNTYSDGQFSMVTNHGYVTSNGFSRCYDALSSAVNSTVYEGSKFTVSSITKLYLFVFGLTYFPVGTVIEIYGRAA